MNLRWVERKRVIFLPYKNTLEDKERWSIEFLYLFGTDIIHL